MSLVTEGVPKKENSENSITGCRFISITQKMIPHTFKEWNIESDLVES